MHQPFVGFCPTCGKAGKIRAARYSPQELNFFNKKCEFCCASNKLSRWLNGPWPEIKEKPENKFISIW
jgi:hypothetical protein